MTQSSAEELLVEFRHLFHLTEGAHIVAEHNLRPQNGLETLDVLCGLEPSVLVPPHQTCVEALVNMRVLLSHKRTPRSRLP